MSYLNYIITFRWKYWGFKDGNKIILWECLEKALSCLLWLWYKDQNQTAASGCSVLCTLSSWCTFMLPWALAGKQLGEQSVSRQPPPHPITQGPSLQPAALCLPARPQARGEPHTNPCLLLPHRGQQCPSAWCSPTECVQSSCSKCGIFMVSLL